MEDLENKYHFKIIKEIGSGAFGSVYKIQDKNDNKVYALKKIVLNKKNKEDLDSIKNEAYLLKTIDNENIIKYIDSFFYDDSFYLIMEFCSNLDLRSFINDHKKENKLISEATISRIISNLCGGIKAIHNNNMIHRDLKPENIFISDNYKIKIGDFGISKILNETNYAQTYAGTLLYMAPEMINGDKYTNKVDIWALGCIIYELCTLDYCFSDNIIPNIINKINTGKHGIIDTKYYSDRLQNLIDLSLKKNYRERASIEDIIAILKKPTLNEIKKTFSVLPNDKDLKIMNSISGPPIPKEEADKTGGWGSYIFNMLLNKKDTEGNIYNNILYDAAIIGLNGLIWSSTVNFSLNAGSIETLNNIFNKKLSSISSISIRNKTYKIVNYKQGFSIDFTFDEEGGTIAKTNLSFVVGLYNKNKFYMLNGEKHNQCLKICNYVVEDLANELKNQNY